MKRISIITFILVIILTGCSKHIKPIKVVKTDFDIHKAEIIMKRAWKPVHTMTNSNYETIPNIPISSREEFLDKYDFSFMNKSMACDIYNTIVDFHDNKEVRDNKGNLVFGGGIVVPYVPTIYDKGIAVEKAYLRDSRYKKEYSRYDIVELVVEEISNNQANDYVSNFSRLNIFRKDEKGNWILYGIRGTISISWSR